MVIKLEYDDWTLYAEIIRVFVAIASNPAEITVIKVAADLFFADCTRGIWEVQEETALRCQERAVSGPG